VGTQVGVKASGGVRTLEDALAMIAAGATRIGTSSLTSERESRARARESGIAWRVGAFG